MIQINHFKLCKALYFISGGGEYSKKGKKCGEWTEIYD